ncbi:MAG: 1-acyl-sn-glycerol-3-phosphate acyltransferase [Hyphomicrobium sp.]|nr:1-acyl-sn-glycerol-3-phosphate acyltransferase [Hyphomicrobium sp.]
MIDRVGERNGQFIQVSKSSPEFPELTYADPGDPPLRRWLIRNLERLSGRDALAPHYARWKTEVVPKGGRVIEPMLKLIDVELEIVARDWPPKIEPGQPVVIVANHPYGIMDGIAALTLAEDLGRPFRVLINKDLMKVPEIRPYSLPIDFDPTREAQATNLATRKEAIRLLGQGTTIVVFPAGGVATAPNPLGYAVDLPWKSFVARLVQSVKATVIPVYFEGQCTPLFHAVSRLSLTLRLSLLIHEFRRKVGSSIVARIGLPVPFAALQNAKDRKALVQELYNLVHAEAPRVPPKQARLPRWLRGETE